MNIALIGRILNAAGGTVGALPAAPTNSVAPVASGTAAVGSTLSCTTGTWTGSPSFTYQWKRGGSNISSATSSTYVLVSADAGQSIKCTVTGSNGGGSAQADSNAITGIVDVPTNTVAPSLSGTEASGSTLTCANGTWTGSPSFTYQWIRNTNTTIVGETSQTYVLQAADEGNTVKCTVTGTNAAGNASATSASSGTIASGVTTYASDTFTRANSATLGTTETGSKTWVQQDRPAVSPGYTSSGSTRTTLTSNKVALANPDSNSNVQVWAVVNSGVSDCTVSASVTLSGTRACPGIIFRSTGSSNGIVVFLEKFGGTDAIQMQSFSAGSYTNIGSTVSSAGLSLGSTYTLKAVLSGTSIKIYLDDVLKIDTTSSTNQSSTYHGIQAYCSTGSSNDDAGSTFDNFSVTS